MSTFAERLWAAMSRAGLKSTDVHELTKISKSTISEYLSGSYEPKQKNIYKLSKALGVEPSYLMGLSKVEPSPSPAPEKPVLTDRDERDIQKKLKSIIDDLDPSSGLAYYNGDAGMDDETRDLIRASLETSLRTAKQLAKAKYTPKKYRDKK